MMSLRVVQAFVLNIAVNDTTFVFEPTIKEISDLLLNTCDVGVAAIEGISRVEKAVFPALSKNTLYIR